MGTMKKGKDPLENLQSNAELPIPTLDAAAISNAYNAILEGFSDEERSLMQEMLQNLSQGAFSSQDPFQDLAEEYDLSVDASDIELFLAVELARAAMFGKFTKKRLDADPALRERLIDKAIDRVLVGLCLTGITESGRKELRYCAEDAAAEILDSIDLSIIKAPLANNLREALMDIY